MAERLHKEAYDASPTSIITALQLFKTPSLILLPPSSTRTTQIQSTASPPIPKKIYQIRKRP